MPSETTVDDKRQLQAPPPNKPSEPLPCPRCDSTNTKFCYYNNYNLSQPRHFCKGCRRYWTQGGTLRNVPVGGGNRKSSSKRSRSSSSSSSSSSTATTSTSSSSPTTTSNSDLTREPEPGPGNNPILPKGEVEGLCSNLPISENGAFLSLLNANGPGLAGFGLGSGFGLCEMGLGFGGRGGVWSYPAGMGFWGDAGNGEAGGGTSVCNTWQLGGVEGGDGGGGGGGGGVVDGDGLVWPGLGISMPGLGFK